MTKIVDDRIALVTIKVKYALMEEEVEITSTITPFEYCSKMSILDQYDFLSMAYSMIDVEASELDVDDYISFQESLDFTVIVDDINIVNLN